MVRKPAARWDIGRASQVVALVALVVLVAPAGCSGEESLTPEIPDAACENLEPLHCLLPWPSSRFLVDAAATATGKRVALPPSGMPLNSASVAVDAAMLSRYDGFSPNGSAMTAFAKLLDTSSLAGEDRIAESLLPGAVTVLLDAESKQRVAHFAEVDEWVPKRSSETLYIRPATRLRENHRYIVAIRAPLRYADGSPVQPSDYFRALRDGVATDVPEVEARRARYEDIFSRLAAAGVERETLILAWEFHTASGKSLWGDLLAMRDDWVAWRKSAGTTCTITESKQDASDPLIFRSVSGTLRVPLYLTRATVPGRIQRDGRGAPERNGEVTFAFAVLISHAAKKRRDAGQPVPMIVSAPKAFTAGASQAASYVTNRFAHWTLDAYGALWATVDATGMLTEDLNAVASAVSNVGEVASLVDRLAQGMISVLALRAALADGCAAARPELADALALGGRRAWDSTVFGWNNASQHQHASLVALSPTPARAVTKSIMAISAAIKRATIVGASLADLRKHYPDRVERDLALLLLQLEYDRIENGTFAPHVLSDPLPGSARGSLLLATTRYNSWFANSATDMLARTAGLKLLTPSAYSDPPWSVSASSTPSASGYVVTAISGAPRIAPGAREPAGGDNFDWSTLGCSCWVSRITDFMVGKPARGGCVTCASKGAPADPPRPSP